MLRNEAHLDPGRPLFPFITTPIASIGMKQPSFPLRSNGRLDFRMEEPKVASKSPEIRPDVRLCAQSETFLAAVASVSLRRWDVAPTQAEAVLCRGWFEGED